MAEEIVHENQPAPAATEPVQQELTAAPEAPVPAAAAPDEAATLRAELESLRPVSFARLAPMVNQWGGEDRALQTMQAMTRVLQSPAMAKAVMEFLQTGKTPQEAPFDPYAPAPTPPDPRDLKIQELEQRIQKAESAGSQVYVNQHLDRLKAEWGEDYPAILKEIGPQIQMLDGTDIGRQTLGDSKLLGEYLDTVALKVLKPRLKEIGKRLYEQDVEKVKSAATGPQPSRATAANEPSPRAKSALQAWRDNCIREGVDPDKPRFYGPAH